MYPCCYYLSSYSTLLTLHYGNDKGSPDPSNHDKCHKEPPEGGSGSMKSPLQTPFLNPDPFPMMVWDRECSQSEDKWGKLHGPPTQWCTGEYYYAKVC